MKIAVFGGSGFIGRHTVKLLKKAGHEVKVFDLNPCEDLETEFEKVDLLDKEKILTSLKGFDVVYHYAGWANMSSSSDSATEVIESNVLGTTYLLEACVKNKVKKFVFASSMYVFSRAGSFYRTSKQCCELIIEEFSKQHGINFCILRYGSLYGPKATHGNGLYEILNQAVKEKKVDYWGDGEEHRQYIHVEDAAKGSVEVLEKEFDNSYISLTGLEDVKIKDLLEMVKEIFDGKIDINYSTSPQKDHHYWMTPFNFLPKTGKKLIFNSYKDLGQGILECIHEVYQETLEKDA